MKKVQETYLALLRAALWGGELTNEGVKELTNESVNEIIRLAAFQGTGPLVYDQLLKMKDVEISAGLRMQMKQQCMQSMLLQQRMFPILSQAWEALKQADIQPVLLKGFGLAQYYPQPHLRQFGDIDLYVGKKQFHKGCAVLRETFAGIKHTKHDDDDYKHYNFEFGYTVLELHRVNIHFPHPSDRRYYEEMEARSQTGNGPSIDINGLSIVLPDETFNVFFVFVHAWHHFIESGMSMKQLCDVAILLHALHANLNYERLHELLTQLRLMEVWRVYMYMLVHYLGMPKDECPFYSEKCSMRAQAFFERVMQEGQARIKEEVNAEGKAYLKRKFMTFQLRLADSKLVYPYAPKCAVHMIIGDVLHGIERTIKGLCSTIEICD